MENKERFELLAKLSEFYVKEVKNRLPEFNKAIKLANIANLILWVSFIVFVSGGVFALSVKNFNINMNLTLAVICIAFFGAMSVLAFFTTQIIRIDDKNEIKIFDKKIVNQDGKTKCYLKGSADDIIKEFLTSKFIKIFGESFEWVKANTTYFDGGLLKKYNILKSPILTFDDCILGVYKNIYIRIFEGNTSFFQKHIIGILGFAIILFTIFLPAIIIIPAFIIFTICGFFPKLFPYLLTFFIIFIVVLIFYGIKYFKLLVMSKVFRGLFVELELNKNFKGHTIVLEKDNPKNQPYIDKTKFQKIELEDIEFNNKYDVYSDSQIESRYLLTPAFMERFNKLKEIYNAKYIRAAFKSGKIVIAIHTGRDMFKMADIISETGEETFVQIFNEIVSILDIIDVMNLDSNTGL